MRGPAHGARAVDDPAFSGVITKSLAYSTLQAGPEFARWLAERGPASMPEIPDPVEAARDGDELRVRFNRPGRHNAFSTDARAALLEALEVARLDPGITRMVLDEITARLVRPAAPRFTVRCWAADWRWRPSADT
jgi:hypothetical protein